MNVKNLERTIEMLKGIPQEKFDMRSFRKHTNDEGHICGSVGCIVGHATMLDTEENIKDYMDFPDEIEFYEWSLYFYDLYKTRNVYDLYKTRNVWDYMFSEQWADYERTNTPEHAIYRIQKIIDGYEPNNIIIEYNLEYSKRNER